MRKVFGVVATIFAGVVVLIMSLIDWLLWLLVPIAIIIFFLNI